MSRQRLRHSLGKANETLCSRCNGEGTVRTIESLSLSLLRSIEKEALKKSTQQIRVEIPVDMATYLTNEKRAAREQIEQRYKINILLIPNPYWQSPHYKITGQGKNINLQTSENASYQMLDKSCAESSLPYSSPVIKPVEIPAVKPLTFAISKNKPKTQLGLLSRLLGMLKDLSKTKELSKNSVKKELATVPIHNHSNDTPHRHSPEKRYSKANRNNRLRSHRRDDRRDKEGEGGSEGGGGQHHHNGGKTSQNRYNKHHQQRYESAPHQQSTHHNNKSVSAPIAGASERKLLPNKRRQHSEKSVIKHEHKINTQAIREENTRSTPKPALNNAERKTVIPSRSVEKSALSIEKKPAAEQIANTANVNNSSKQSTNTSNPSTQRRNTRRYGGEPKLRHRTYSHYEQDQKTKN
jgi:ribonuclease E